MDPTFYLAFALLTADYAQTRDIAQHPTYWERNPAIGLHPSVGKVSVYFAGMAGALTVSQFSFSKDTVRTINVATAVVEATMVGHNASLGLKFTF